MGDQDDSMNEDQWLYGDGPGVGGQLPETNGVPSKTEPAIPGVSPEPRQPAEGPLDPPPPGIQREDGEEDGELPAPPGEEEIPPSGAADPAPPGEEGSPKEEGEEDDDDDDSDDDIRVTIGNIKTAPTAPYTGVNKMRGAVLSSGLDKLSKPGKFSIDEFESIGSINGMPAHEFSIDALEDKPWRKPGSDITDYFNYGFNEDTWRAYCERQKALRVQESGVGLGGLGVPRNPVPINLMSDNKYSGGAMPPSMGVPPPIIPSAIGSARGPGGPMGQMQGARRPSGVIDVIGGGIASRRTTDSPPNENVIQVMSSERRDFRKSFDLTVPPPGFDAPPPGVAPPVMTGYPPYGADYHYGGDVDYYTSNFEPTQEIQSWVSEGGSANKDALPGGITIKEEPIDKGYKEKEKDRERDRDRSDRHKERSHRHRSRSRSTERDRRTSRKHKSRSRSPGHRSHKKKKSKKSDKRDTGSD